jgi:enoyl-CoA hydratase/carnithine racemase
MILTGDPITADDALRVGLVNEITEPGQVLERAVELASVIATRAPLALAAAKRLRDQASSLPLDAALELERETVALLFATADRAEGTAAFVEKREPHFRGV